MKENNIPFGKSYILGVSFVLAAFVMGLMLVCAVRTLKSYDDTVKVRGLCEKEVPADSGKQTRGFLTVSGRLAGEDVAFIVCHWPSRRAASYYREVAGRQVRLVKDSILKANPATKVFVMGDLNDNPTNKSVYEALGAKAKAIEVAEGEMFNPWHEFLTQKGVGTLRWDGKWDLFDQIIITPNLVGKKGDKNYEQLTYWKAQIFQRDYLLQTEGKYKGNPKRTTAGGVWLNGYSDHLPVVAYFVKQQK